jgi:hypothetical protein
MEDSALANLSANPRAVVLGTLERSSIMAHFDPQRDFCHDQEGHWSQHTALAMPLETNEGVVVHVVDDDVSLRGALKDLFETVGLATRTYGTARDFLKSGITDMPGCIVIDCPNAKRNSCCHSSC